MKQIALFIIILITIVLVRDKPNHSTVDVKQMKIDTLKSDWIIKTKALRKIYKSDIWMN